MIGHYQTEQMANSATMSSKMPTVRGCSQHEPSPTVVTLNSVKSLVCSPDLSVYASPACGVEALKVEEKPFQCMLCQKAFDQKSLYQSHLRSHGKEGEDPYRCNICGKTFAVPARLTRHYRTHTGEKPYQCEYCNKSFSVKENLSVHRRIHTKERPYKCDVCNRAFEHSGKLHRHMRIHTGERPHKCTVCSKTFIQSGQLVIHMRTHTGEKPYVCKACGKGFTCSKQLKVHTRTHTGEKPYTCDICGKSFGYNHVLKLHQVAHYGEKVYKCTLCHETFGSKKTMELHIKTHSDSSVVGSPRDSPIEPEIEISPSNGLSTKKEELKTEEPNEDTAVYNNTPQDFPYYMYSREQYSQPLQVPKEDRCHQSTPVVPLEPPHMIFLCPDASPTYTSFGIQSNDYSDCSSLLNLPGNDARRRVEAALEAAERDPILTPPSSNPVSPVPSPDPLDLAIPVRETLILPPRKRCKMILESMEIERNGLIASQRQSSVIQFAKAS
ncbi:Krueppel homolog 1-like [Ceratina calcarata]|uniref:Krueppel homolog 1-like n=1 Tax=Ceratina calcarata TaxID=156304 RepID=A0AAJ7NA26_9HYME|nr:Krueppel homolog 1-like [Ceratina calcarata]